MKEAPVKAPMFDKSGPLSKVWRFWFADIYASSKTTLLQKQTTTPADPGKGSAVLWLNSNDDLKVKITDSTGVTKTATLADFSTL